MTTPTVRLVHRLAFGLELYDALTGVGVAADAVAEWPHAVDGPSDHQPKGSSSRRVGLDRRLHWRRLAAGGIDFGRFHANHGPGVRPPVTVRITDGQRRFVPRRLTVQFPTLADVLAAETGRVALGARGWRIGLWPGAAYPHVGGRCGLRGRLEDPIGNPVPWGQVVARLVVRNRTTPELIGRAHVDDRGEFVLILTPAGPAAPRPHSRDFLVELTGWAPPLVSNAAFTDDPLDRLPIDELADSAGMADVAAGIALQRGATAWPPRLETVGLGRIRPLLRPVMVPTPVAQP